MLFNGGVEMLHGGDYYPDVSNWSKINVVELTDTSLRLSVIRDQAGQDDGLARLSIISSQKNKA